VTKEEEEEANDNKEKMMHMAKQIKQQKSWVRWLIRRQL
jgi:hypothetical protein